MRAILIGATGATGKDLLDLLIDDKSITEIRVFSRRELNIQHQKLTVHIINFDQPEEWKHLVVGDVLYSCLGTTLKDAGSKQAQWIVDYDYQYLFAKIAKENNVGKYLLVSSAFASSSSIIFYSRMKGQLEDDVQKLNFETCIIFNPPSLIRKNTNRKNEARGVKFISALNSIGLMKSSKPLSTEVLALTLLNSSKQLASGFHRIEKKEIEKWG